MVTISIGKADTECPDKVTLTSGMVKAVQVVFTFSDEWDGFNKIAVFSNGKTSLDVSLNEEDKCYIPHEILAEAGKEVTVGVYGTKGVGDDYTAIPTEKCSLGKVVEGVNPSGEEPNEPTPTIFEDLMIRVKNLEEGNYVTSENIEVMKTFGDYDNFYTGMVGGYVDTSNWVNGIIVKIKNSAMPLLYASRGSSAESIPATEEECISILNTRGNVEREGFVFRKYSEILGGDMGDINTALDSILAMENALIGGGA